MSSRVRAVAVVLLVLCTAGASSPWDLAKLRQRQAVDREMLGQAKQWPARGVAAYLPPGGRPQGEEGIFDAVALLAIPLVRRDQFPIDAAAALFTTYALADRQLVPRLRQFLAGGRRALVTSRLAARLGGLPSRYADRVFVVSTAQGAASLRALPQTTVDHARNFILYPLGLRVEAPPRVALSLYGQEALLVENFNDFAAGLKVTFRRPVWPEVPELRTGDGRTVVRVDYNLAQVQVGPRTTRLLRVAARGKD